ncbi:MAG TPA: Tex-like N-terminal domain-containing protein, partial [Saprospiraceae bacterium]|nr:Tex-like N-terminal domain-containing protein [Saprospiraceae bacterium]
MDNQQHITLIAKELNLPEKGVKNTFQLFQDGATIPFIARYRKELTGSLDEVQIAAIQRQMKKLEEIEDRKLTILNAIEEQQKLTPELRSKIMLTWDANELEDIYLPYKRRKKTRADIAREYGLEPLAKIIMSQKGSNIDEQARRFLNKEITSIEEAIQGASDIIAEWVSEDQHIREILRNNFRKYAKIVSRVVPKMKENAGNYQDYFEFEESLSRCPSHRYLAMMRGKKEGILKITLVIDDEKARTMMERKFIRSHGHEARLIAEAIADSYDRLIFPSVETQIFNDFREKADDAAIDVFSKNLRQLLLSPPLGQKAVVAVDPGFRTGCKVV